MNYSRAIRTAASIWTLGVLVFLIASYLPLSNNPELHANLALAIAFLPLAWFGARYYYKKGAQTPGYQLAIFFAFSAALLDAIITVPIFFLPMGMTYSEFFGAPGFWFLIVEYAGVVILYDFFRRRRELSTTQIPNHK